MNFRAALIVAFLYLLLQVAGLRSAALTDDDDFYMPAGISYAEWLGKAFSFQGGFQRSAIDSAFQQNKEHPPFAKYIFGVSHFALRWLLGPVDATRFGTILFSSLIAFLLMWMSLHHFGFQRGFRVGGFAVLALLTLPRFYFHSHAPTLDVPVAAMILATCALILRGERSSKAALAAGPVFGLAAATKLNAPFLLFAYLPFVVLTRVRAPARDSGFRLPPLPLTLLSMALLGPLTFWLIWPWLWFDTIPRVVEYVGFHLHHYGIYFLYFGRVFVANPFGPWHAPFMMTLFTVPVATLVLAGTGVALAFRPILQRLRFRDGPDDDKRREGDLLLLALLNLIVTISVVAFAGTPIYGGEKLFMPFFPFLCLFAGYGANYLYERLRVELPRFAHVVPIVACASGVMLMLRYGEYALSSYNGVAGGLRGATAMGFERQYYDLAFRGLARRISKDAPIAVHFLPNNWEYVRTYRWLQRAGDVSPQVSVTQHESQARRIIITHERRFARYGDDLQRCRGAKILEEKLVDGVPIWSMVEK